MVKIIAVCGVLALGALAIIAVAVASRPRPTMPAADKRLLDDAARLMARMHHQTDLDHVDLLSDRSREATKKWLTTYNERHAK